MEIKVERICIKTKKKIVPGLALMSLLYLYLEMIYRFYFQVIESTYKAHYSLFIPNLFKRIRRVKLTYVVMTLDIIDVSHRNVSY